jgi:hypothetical protein
MAQPQEAKMSNVRKAGFVSFITFALLLGACSGSNSGGPAEAPPPLPKGF